MKNIFQHLDLWAWIRIALAVLLIVGAYIIGVVAGMSGSQDKRGYSDRGGKYMDKNMRM
jgi:hypothetical protein